MHNISHLKNYASILLHKIKGNPLFFNQLLLSLSRDGLLRLSLSLRRWVWDEDQIQSRKLPHDVAEFMAVTIEKLPEEVQIGLKTLACFGASSKCTLLKLIETKFGTPIIEPLEFAVAEGLLDKVDKTFRFGHDRLQVSLSQCVCILLFLPET